MPFQQAPNASVQLPVFLPGTREHQFGQTTPGLSLAPRRFMLTLSQPVYHLISSHRSTLPRDKRRLQCFASCQQHQIDPEEKPHS
ncbi:hypothetical protein U0070_007217 [Myodes glareolus]|uniref:Uncharacterized protein n=1 Tax=Myodes glareolus TaxID=447135 RepID=A0AAW0JQX5_MYOGA